MVFCTKRLGIPTKHDGFSAGNDGFLLKTMDGTSTEDGGFIVPQNAAGNDIIHTTLKLPAIKNREMVTMRGYRADPLLSTLAGTAVWSRNDKFN